VRAMVSHPAYDPNQLDGQFDQLVADQQAPLLNRATQGQYQPGLALQPFILAAALDQNLLRLNSPVEDANSPIRYGQTVLRCASPPPAAPTWADVLAHACPAPMLPLSAQFGPAGLENVYAAFGLTSTLTLPLATEAAANPTVDDPALAVIGQENLTVTPLQVSLALAALANGGQLPAPQLVTAVQSETGEWQPLPADGEARAAVSPAAAQAILAALPRHESLSEYATLALAGPGGTQNAWYLGFAPAGAPQYVVVVLVEESESPFAAQRLGRALLNAILAPR
jgi:penicillin-binding protein A